MPVFMYCSTFSPDSLAMYYRESMVYTPFAATGLGLGAIAIISILDGWEWWKARKEKTASTTVIPSCTGNIQTGTLIVACTGTCAKGSKV